MSENLILLEESRDLLTPITKSDTQVTISTKGYEYVMTQYKNEKGYIKVLDDNCMNLFDFDSNGKLVLSEYVKKQLNNTENLPLSTDQVFIVELFTILYNNRLYNDNYTITIEPSKFFKEMNIDYRYKYKDKLLSKILELQNCVGIIEEDKSVWKVLDLIGFSEDKLVFSCPYFLEILRKLDKENTIETNKKTYTKPYVNKLIDKSIGNEKNKESIDLLYRLTNGLLRLNSNQKEYHISFKTLINEVPSEREKILKFVGTKNERQNINKTLSRDFTKMWELLETKTQIKEYFGVMDYEKKIPTYSTLDDCIVIRFSDMTDDKV